MRFVVAGFHPAANTFSIQLPGEIGWGEIQVESQPFSRYPMRKREHTDHDTTGEAFQCTIEKSPVS